MRTNIIFVIHSPFPYYAGGIETWLYNLSSRLCENHNVTILSETKTFYREPFFQLDRRIKVVHYDSLRKYYIFRKVLRGPLSIIDNLNISHSITQTLFRLVDDNQTHYVVVLNTLFAATAVNKVRQKRDNIRFVCSARGPHAEIASQKSPWFKNYFHTMERRNLTQADIALSNGYDTISHFEKQGIKTLLMKNGIDTKRFSITSEPLPESEMPLNRINIVSVATLLEIKGISEMIAATAILIKRGYNNVCLILIGKGGQRRYRQQAKSLGVDKNVLFLGHKSNVVPYLQQASLICCLSGGGGLSMSALESMASGRPVIAWDTPVYRQFNRNEKTMELVEEKNCELLADKIEQVMLSPEKTTDMTEHAIIETQRYDWEIVVRDFEEYIKL